MKAACAAGIVAATLTAAPAHACLILVGDTGGEDMMAAEPEIGLFEETLFYGAKMVAQLTRLIHGDTPADLLAPRQSPCGRRMARPPRASPVATVVDATASGAPVEYTKSALEQVTSRRPSGIRLADEVLTWDEQPGGPERR